MKYKTIALGIVAILIFAGGLIAVQGGNDNKGNGAPSGPHYTLNILGKDWEKDEDTSVYDNNGHRIFVRLDGKTKIWLTNGTDFNVIDADGTDRHAEFQLPKPDTIVDNGGTPDDPSDDTVIGSRYYAYIRILGKPEGWADMYSGFINESGVQFLSLEVIELRQYESDGSGNPNHKLVTRESPPKFEDVTKELTTIFVDITDDDVYNPQRYGLFDDELWDYFWEYDNHGLKHVQIRFYDSPQV